MAWVVRTYKVKVDSGYGYTGKPQDKTFNTKSEAVKYRSELKVYSELFESDYSDNEKKD